jgi:hypothetical protein
LGSVAHRRVNAERASPRRATDAVVRVCGVVVMDATAAPHRYCHRCTQMGDLAP